MVVEGDVKTNQWSSGLTVERGSVCGAPGTAADARPSLAQSRSSVNTRAVGADRTDSGSPRVLLHRRAQTEHASAQLAWKARAGAAHRNQGPGLPRRIFFSSDPTPHPYCENWDFKYKLNNDGYLIE